MEDLAQNFLGLDLFLDDLSDFDRTAGAQVFGAAEPTSGVIKVDLRAVDYQPLYRSTVMHEVAHVVLHQGHAARVMNYSPRSPRRPGEEREADRFMAESRSSTSRSSSRNGSSAQVRRSRARIRPAVASNGATTTSRSSSTACVCRANSCQCGWCNAGPLASPPSSTTRRTRSRTAGVKRRPQCSNERSATLWPSWLHHR